MQIDRIISLNLININFKNIQNLKRIEFFLIFFFLNINIYWKNIKIFSKI